MWRCRFSGAICGWVPRSSAVIYLMTRYLQDILGFTMTQLVAINLVFAAVVWTGLRHAAQVPAPRRTRYPRRRPTAKARRGAGPLKPTGPSGMARSGTTRHFQPPELNRKDR
jgi:hypothetical protein